MKALGAQVPEILIQEPTNSQRTRRRTVDQIVSIALAAQVCAWRTRESIPSRAHRVNWRKVDEILARVPDVPPQLGDEIQS